MVRACVCSFDGEEGVVGKVVYGLFLLWVYVGWMYGRAMGCPWDLFEFGSEECDLWMAGYWW